MDYKFKKVDIVAITENGRLEQLEVIKEQYLTKGWEFVEYKDDGFTKSYARFKIDLDSEKGKKYLNTPIQKIIKWVKIIAFSILSIFIILLIAIMLIGTNLDDELDNSTQDIKQEQKKIIKKTVKQKRYISKIKMLYKDDFFIDNKWVSGVGLILNTIDNGQIVIKIKTDNFKNGYTYKGGVGIKNFDDIYSKEIYISGKWDNVDYSYTPTLKKCKFNLMIESFNKNTQKVKLSFSTTLATKNNNGGLDYKNIDNKSFTIANNHYRELQKILTLNKKQ